MAAYIVMFCVRAYIDFEVAAWSWPYATEIRLAYIWRCIDKN